MGSTAANASNMATPRKKPNPPQTGSLISSPILQADELCLNPRWSPHLKSPRPNSTISSRLRMQNSPLRSNGNEAQGQLSADGTSRATLAADAAACGPTALTSPLSKRARILQTNSPESLPPLSPVVSTRKRSMRADLAQDTPFPFSPTASGLRIRYSPSSPLSPTLRSTPNRNEPESPTLSRMLVKDSPVLSLDEKLGNGSSSGISGSTSSNGIDEDSPSVSQMSRSLLFRLDLESPTTRRALASADTDKIVEDSPLKSSEKGKRAVPSSFSLRRSPTTPSVDNDDDRSENNLVATARERKSESADEQNYKQVPGIVHRSSWTIRNGKVVAKLDQKRRKLAASRASVVPQLFVSLLHPRTDPAAEKSISQQLERIRIHFDGSFGAREADFAKVTVECGLPQFANRALFRYVSRCGIDSTTSSASANGVIGKRVRHTTDKEVWPSFEQFHHVWTRLQRSSTDVHSLLFNILVDDATKLRPYLTRENIKVLVSDVIDHHCELEFLEGQDQYALSYMETVIERIFYNANRSWDGKLTLSQFRQADIVGIMRSVESGIDIDVESPGVFSYKHFYVLFCSFFELDCNRDRLLDARDLLRYFNGILSRRTISRIMMGKGKPSEYAAERKTNGYDSKAKAKAEKRKVKGTSRYDLNVRLSDCRMTYRDFIWFLLSEIDKTSRTAVEYWFRCLDLDGDGILTIYELEYFYDEQVSRMEEDMAGDIIMLEDLMCQLSDLVRPEKEGLFTLKDLRKVPSSLLPVFFDAFMNLTRFVEHETRTSFLQRQLAQLSMRALPKTSFSDVIQMRIDFLASIPNAWIEFADLEYAALLNDHQEYDENKQKAEEAPV
ncbi:Serine/threonine-protein phosphatase 2A regulatory subunit B'' subunit alpha [Coemansia spiralis]|uniref:Serine/threonine-protein phosphatase 2A regulatory subunit B'' subunit alpha n=2 Tax=Coemansia TaxID=4863 RepID=A0A9W8KZX0_9FUNG|nr:Serine/threonine-protein phosphatase 2A regulatory subunit B'' subunit alpha [Coemansia umbellata]KAJ2622756.1 Serine/threonine-protein phosphatase 2A regulatory subunit B'' subunit alpha [Coemansia sp. RSA 1358]KAJ2679032.1 Serine/threonine-protein phosphatase 2A regulatory subunit B'' subunit alpha [Coemansia spiralis]